jgi:hypothetical protein
MSAPKIHKSTAGQNLAFSMEYESGVIITGFSRNVTSTVAEAADKDNVVQAVAHTGFRAEISIDGFLKTDSDFEVGSIIAVANEVGSHGLAGGTVIVNGVNESRTQGEFATVSISATQYQESLTLTP